MIRSEFQKYYNIVINLINKNLAKGFKLSVLLITISSCMRLSHSETTSKQEAHSVTFSIIRLFNLGMRHISR